MTDEPEINDIDDADNQPATHGDLAIWGGRLQEQIADLKQDVTEIRGDVSELKEGQARLEKQVGSLTRSQESILEVVKSIDQQLREHNTHPDRIARLERSVFRR